MVWFCGAPFCHACRHCCVVRWRQERRSHQGTARLIPQSAFSFVASCGAARERIAVGTRDLLYIYHPVLSCLDLSWWLTVLCSAAGRQKHSGEGPQEGPLHEASLPAPPAAGPQGQDPVRRAERRAVLRLFPASATAGTPYTCTCIFIYVRCMYNTSSQDYSCGIARKLWKVRYLGREAWE